MPGRSDDPQCYALYPLRIVLAMLFMWHGWSRFTALAGTTAMFDGWGIPTATVLTPLVATAELFGGLGILLGVLPRFSASVLSLVMITAIWSVKFDLGFWNPGGAGWGVDAIVLGGLVTLVINGAGRPTLFSILQKEEWDPEARVLAGRGRPV